MMTDPKTNPDTDSEPSDEQTLTDEAVEQDHLEPDETSRCHRTTAMSR